MSDDGREHDRSNVFLGATLHTAGKSTPVRVRNLSSRGALLEGTDIPGEGAEVELQRGSLAVCGKVAWVGGSQRGIRFDKDIEVARWVKPIGHAGQQRVDAAVDSIRRGSRPALSVEKPVAGPETLETLGRQIEDITEQLAATPDISVDVAEKLLKLEDIAHQLMQIARR